MNLFGFVISTYLIYLLLYFIYVFAYLFNVQYAQLPLKNISDSKISDVTDFRLYVITFLARDQSFSITAQEFKRRAQSM